MDVRRRKKSGKEKQEGPLSKVPKELLRHILSFLSTKEAASTSVLSKRWRNLFTLIPSLDLDDSLFVSGDRPEEDEREDYEPKEFEPEEYKRSSFMEFVNRFFALQSDSPITKFSLVCHKGVDELVINDWIVKALRRGATELTLVLLHPTRGYALPPSIYLYGPNLVKLRLGRGELGLFSRSLLGNLSFAKLKTLHLDFHSMSFGPLSGSGLALLLSKCPVLEELIVNYMKWHRWKSGASVSSSTLRRLTIDSAIYHSKLPSSINSDIKVLYATLSPQQVSFDTPNLLYLNYADFLARNYPLIKLDSLVEARLDVGVTSIQRKTRDSDELEIRWDATNLIMGIHNVQTLHLTSDTLEVISDFCKTIPVFHNLNHLSIESNAEQGWEALPLLLTNCPNLHTLVLHGLHHGVTDGCGDVCDCISPSSAVSCLSMCPVKVLEISNFGATCGEMSQVEHFLKKMPQLEQVIIVLSFDSFLEDDLGLFEVSSALEMVPRASPNCNLKVVS